MKRFYWELHLLIHLVFHPLSDSIGLLLKKVDTNDCKQLKHCPIGQTMREYCKSCETPVSAKRYVPTNPVMFWVTLEVFRDLDHTGGDAAKSRLRKLMSGSELVGRVVYIWLGRRFDQEGDAGKISIETRAGPCR